MKKIAWLLMFATMVLVACKSSDSEINVTLNVKTFSFEQAGTRESSEFQYGETIHILMELQNNLAKDARLEFVSGQQFDIEVIDVNGERLWLWSSDKAFTQANSELILYSLELSVLHEEGINKDQDQYLPAGDYKIRAWLANGKGNLAERSIKVLPETSL
ncbi:MAG: hypothetical protein HWE16_14370 [Gammaproteobacteria bacterium]|nr:hypothetical protein [Gammaproteobacteria bacterium]